MLEAGSDKSNLPPFVQIRFLLVLTVLLYVTQLNFQLRELIPNQNKHIAFLF